LRAKLEVGPEGAIAVPPRQAEALGLSGGGEVDFVSARGACALLVPARQEKPQGWFAGSLAALNFPEIVQFVFSSLKTGVLLMSFSSDAEAHPPEVPEGLRRKSIYFREGQVVFASSSDPHDRLGPVLGRAGLVTGSDLERCSRLVRSGQPLGRVLVDEQIIDAGQLYEGITLQVKEIFLGCFLETVGEFAFLEGTQDDQHQVKLPERTRDLILEGMKRLEEAELRRAEEALAAGPPSEIVIDVEVPALTPPPGAKPPVRVPRSAGPFETYRRIFKRVHGALASVEPDASRRLNSWFDRLPEKRLAIFKDVRMTEDGDIDVAAILMNVNASGAYSGAAARARSLEALEEFLAFALFEAKNRLSKPEAERLLREVGRMQVGKA
jgi:hypothetical protein